MDEQDLALVRAAFERLMHKMWTSGCDTTTGRTIYFAMVDVLAILNGEWDDEFGPLLIQTEEETQDDTEFRRDSGDSAGAAGAGDSNGRRGPRMVAAHYEALVDADAAYTDDEVSPDVRGLIEQMHQLRMAEAESAARRRQLADEATALKSEREAIMREMGWTPPAGAPQEEAQDASD